jgi:hypothetical protein
MPNAVLQGSLSAFKVADVLTFLSMSRKTGTLTLTTDDRVSRAVFTNGALVYAEADQDKLRLGSILLRKKRISREQLDRIDQQMRREGTRFGEIAIEQGLLTTDEIRDFLKVQVSEVIYDSFVWTDGTFSFDERPQLPEYAVTITIDLSNLIMEGARRIEEWAQCIELLPDSSVIFRVVSAPTGDKVTLTAEEWKLLFLINGERSIDELVEALDEPPLNVYRTLYGLYANKLLEIVPRVSPPTIIDTDDPETHDETMKQTAPVFYREATIRDAMANDDTNLLVSADARLPYNEAAKAMSARLVVVDGDANGSVIALDEPEYLVGRHSDSSLQISDPGVSGFHCRIFRTGDAYVIEDLKSRNGTWVNGNRVTHATLRPGDELRLGGTSMRYEIISAS